MIAWAMRQVEVKGEDLAPGVIQLNSQMGPIRFTATPEEIPDLVAYYQLSTPLFFTGIYPRYTIYFNKHYPNHTYFVDGKSYLVPPLPVQTMEPKRVRSSEPKPPKPPKKPKPPKIVEPPDPPKYMTLPEINKRFPTYKYWLERLPVRLAYEQARNEEYRRVVRAHLDGATYQEIGNAKGLSKERIRQIIGKVLEVQPKTFRRSPVERYFAENSARELNPFIDRIANRRARNRNERNTYYNLAKRADNA